MASGLREMMAENRQSALMAGGLLLLVAAVSIGYQVFRPHPKPNIGNAFYTVDDGKTWFVDSEDRITPFEMDGAQAVRVRLFRCGHADFVAYLERASPAAQEMARHKVEAINGHRADGQQVAGLRSEIARIVQVSAEIKAPGAGGEWVDKSTPEAAQILGNIRCPNRSDDSPLEVIP